jgi:putrescine transport system substrate-binding protein
MSAAQRTPLVHRLSLEPSMNAKLLRLPVAATIAVLLAACGNKEAAPPPPAAAATAAAPTVETDAEKVLNVYNWSDYIDPGVVPQFEKETGIKVNYDVFDSNEVLETKLLAGRTGYDIVVPSASFLERQIKAGVFQKLDKSRLPNLSNMDEAIAQRIATAHDPGNEHAVNYFWGTSGVGYNEAKIAERMPNAPVDSFAMFYDPDVVSKFKDCGVTVLDAPSEVVGTVLLYLGKDPNSEKPEDLKAAEEALLKIRPYIRSVNSSKYIDDLANGEVCLSLGWVGDVFQARDRANAAGKDVMIKYRIPREGAIMFFDMLAIPVDAPHPINAHLFINFLMRPEIAARNSDSVHYANSNKASYDLISKDVREDPAVYPPPDVMPKLQPDLAESPQFTRLLTRTWTRFKTGK